MSQTLHVISLDEAIALTTRFRQHRTENQPICETFEKAAVLRLLQHEDAVSLRIYQGEKADGKICSVLCAANAEGADILPSGASANESTDDGEILEDAIRCPELCPPPSPLNH